MKIFGVWRVFNHADIPSATLHFSDIYESEEECKKIVDELNARELRFVTEGYIGHTRYSFVVVPLTLHPTPKGKDSQDGMEKTAP